jgi:phage baseplate assembly protein W
MKNENVIYSDLDLNMKIHPNKPERDLNILQNAAAVKRSLKHLLMLEKYDIPFETHITSELHKMIFEPMSAVTAGTMMTMIESTIKAHEPRVNLKQVEVLPNYENSSYSINVYFTLKSLNQDDQLSFILKRPR